MLRQHAIKGAAELRRVFPIYRTVDPTWKHRRRDSVTYLDARNRRANGHYFAGSICPHHDVRFNRQRIYASQYQKFARVERIPTHSNENLMKTGFGDWMFTRDETGQTRSRIRVITFHMP